MAHCVDVILYDRVGYRELSVTWHICGRNYFIFLSETIGDHIPLDDTSEGGLVKINGRMHSVTICNL